jgi:hypothetical protein
MVPELGRAIEAVNYGRKIRRVGGSALSILRRTWRPTACITSWRLQALGRPLLLGMKKGLRSFSATLMPVGTVQQTSQRTFRHVCFVPTREHVLDTCTISSSPPCALTR